MAKVIGLVLQLGHMWLQEIAEGERRVYIREISEHVHFFARGDLHARDQQQAIIIRRGLNVWQI